MESNKQLKICWVVPDLELYNRLWSMQQLYDDWLLRNDVELLVIEYGKRKPHSFLSFIDRISRYLYSWRTPQDLFYRKIYQKQLKKCLTNIGAVDYFFFPATLNYIPELKERGKLCLYTDCMLSDMNPYRNYKFLKFVSSFLFKRRIIEDTKHLDFIFCQNDWSADSFRNKFTLPINRIVNVHFGVNLELYDGDKDYNNHRMLIVLRKGNEYLKGCTLLVKAMPLIRKVISDATLDIVGTDYGNGVEGVVCHVDEPRSTTVELFKKTSLYVMPSHNEPNGVTFLEGLACKAPIVGLNRHAFPEFCGYGSWGFIVEKETPECLARVVCDAFNNPRRLREMGENGQLFVKENFIWYKTSNKIIELMALNNF